MFITFLLKLRNTNVLVIAVLVDHWWEGKVIGERAGIEALNVQWSYELQSFR